MSDDQRREYFRQAGEIQISNVNSVSTSTIGQGLKALKYNEKKSMYELVNNKQSRPTKTADKSNASPRQRRGSGVVASTSDLVTSVTPPDADLHTPSVLDNLETFGSKVWSVLGLPATSTSSVKRRLPPGLSVSGRNTCFLNSVLQCLARAPNLADELAEEVKSCHSEDPEKLLLLDAVSETLQQINVIPGENVNSVVDTTSLCRAGI